MTKRRLIPAYSGFTIVELLVVIVVIGILAAITIVSYSGITSKANIASLSSDLTNASTQLKMFSVDNSNYPSTISTDCVTNPDTTTNKCLKVSNGATYTYYVDNTANNQNFCITATKGSYSYSINNKGSIIPVAYCPVLYLDAGNSLSYPGAGTTWKDLSGNDNNGTLNGGVTYSAANGGVMGFDGVDDYVAIPNASTLTPTVALTISAWAYMVNWDTASNVRVVSKTESGGYQIGINDGGYPGEVGGTLLLGGTYRLVGYARGLVSSGWHNLTLLTDGRYVRFYIDTVQKDVFDLGSVGAVSYSNANNLLVGAEPGGGTSVEGCYFSGKISSVSLYDSALTDAQLQQNFNVIKVRYGL